MPYTVETYESESQWLAARSRSVGASEAAALSRVSKYCGPLGLYWRKIDGEELDDDGSPLGSMAEWGKRLEPVIAQWFTEATKLAISDPGDYTIYRSKERPHVTCTLDRWCDAEAAPVELKCAWHAAAEEWRERIPIAYQIQLQAQLYVTGANHGYFAVLRNGYDARWYRMDRHERFIAKMVARIDEFWQCVERREPPAADGRDLSALFALHPKDDGKAKALGEKAVEAGREFLDLQEQQKTIKEKLEKAKAVIQQDMGDASYGQLPSGAGFSWKTDSRGARRFAVARKVTIPGDAA